MKITLQNMVFLVKVIFQSDVLHMDLKISIKQWVEGTVLNIGAFCSIAMNTTIFLGGNHRTD